MSEPLDHEIQRVLDDDTITAQEAMERIAAQAAAGEGGLVGQLEGEEAFKLMEAIFAMDGEEIPEDIRRFFK